MRHLQIERLWCWEGLGTGGEGDDRGWDGWMASSTWWTCVWVNSGRWWWTGRPGCCSSWGRKESETTERLNWIEWGLKDESWEENKGSSVLAWVTEMVLLCTDGGRLWVGQVWRVRENCIFTHNTSDTMCEEFLSLWQSVFKLGGPIIYLNSDFSYPELESDVTGSRARSHKTVFIQTPAQVVLLRLLSDLLLS